MLTKLVVTVASTISAAPAHPRPMADIIAPGSALAATRAAARPSGIIHRLVSSRPRNTAIAGRPLRLRVAREVGEHQDPRHLVADDDVEAAEPGVRRRRLRRQRGEVRRRLDHGPGDHAADGEEQRHRHAIRQPDGARAERHDGGRHEAQANHPHRHGRRTAEQARAHRRGNHVVHANPGEVRHVEQRGHQPRAAHARGRRARRSPTAPRASARARPAPPRAAIPAVAPAGHQQQRRLGAEVDGERGADLQRGGDDVRAREDDEQVDARLGPRGGWNRRDVGCVHTGRVPRKQAGVCPGRESLVTRQEKLDRMLPVVSGMACLVSAYTTQQGLATATSDLLVSAGVAIAGGAFLFVFSLFLMWRFPYADRHRQLGVRRRHAAGAGAGLRLLDAVERHRDGRQGRPRHPHAARARPGRRRRARPAPAGVDGGEPRAAAGQPVAAVRGPRRPRDARRLLGPSRRGQRGGDAQEHVADVRQPEPDGQGRRRREAGALRPLQGADRRGAEGGGGNRGGRRQRERQDPAQQPRLQPDSGRDQRSDHPHGRGHHGLLRPRGQPEPGFA